MQYTKLAQGLNICAQGTKTATLGPVLLSGYLQVLATFCTIAVENVTKVTFHPEIGSQLEIKIFTVLIQNVRAIEYPLKILFRHIDILQTDTLHKTGHFFQTSRPVMPKLRSGPERSSHGQEEASLPVKASGCLVC